MGGERPSECSLGSVSLGRQKSWDTEDTIPEPGAGLGGDGDLMEADGMFHREEKRQVGTGWKGGHNKVS